MSFISLCKHFMHFNHSFSEMTEAKTSSYLMISCNSSQAISDVLEFRVQIQSEEAVSTIDDISETKVLRDTEVDSLFVFKVTAE